MQPVTHEVMALLGFRWEKLHREYHELLLRIEQAESAIAMLETVGDQQPLAGAGSADRTLQGLRGSLAIESLASKREELASLQAQAAKMLAGDPKLATPLPPPKPPRPPRERPKPIFFVIGGVALLLIVVLFLKFRPGQIQAVTYLLAPTLEQRVTTSGQRYFSQQVPIDYHGGTATLSGDPAPTGQFFVDDRMTLEVAHPDGTTSTWDHDFNDEACEGDVKIDPQDLTSLFQSGRNVVTVSLFDSCGGAAGTTGPVLLEVH